MKKGPITPGLTTLLSILLVKIFLLMGKMVLTSQQRSDVRDVIKDSFNDERFLSTLAQCVADGLQLKIHTLQAENDDLRKQINHLEQNHRMKRLHFSGIREEKSEILTDSIKNLLTDKMQLKSSDILIENCNRIPIKDTNKIRPVYFSILSTRDLVFRSKNRLKGSSIIINDDLTQSNYKLLNTCKIMFGHKKVWTSNANFYVRSNGGEKKLI
ncbi:hypothetical protein WA026_019711 [Henosepilachna vigintioctopunctata]|uniref:Uncharacterized protein n=1 Tax=Henosepilachna vigintioctopunctata TaxID=420089 RepID=A0AAW1UGN3_9CUCU